MDTGVKKNDNACFIQRSKCYLCGRFYSCYNFFFACPPLACYISSIVCVCCDQRGNNAEWTPHFKIWTKIERIQLCTIKWNNPPANSHSCPAIGLYLSLVCCTLFAPHSHICEVWRRMYAVSDPKRTFAIHKSTLMKYIYCCLYRFRNPASLSAAFRWLCCIVFSPRGKIIFIVLSPMRASFFWYARAHNNKCAVGFVRFRPLPPPHSLLENGCELLHL